MSLTRRSFLRSVGSALLLPAAPAIVRATSLMPIQPLLTDAEFLQRCIDFDLPIPAREYLLNKTLIVTGDMKHVDFGDSVLRTTANVQHAIFVTHARDCVINRISWGGQLPSFSLREAVGPLEG